jgi:hypothetical protein
MADARKLAEVLAKLNDVMAEAERLRRDITRQLAEQRESQQQTLSPPPARTRGIRKKR